MQQLELFPCVSASLPRLFSFFALKAQLRVACVTHWPHCVRVTSAGRAVLYSHGDVDVATLLFGSRDRDGEGRLDSVGLVD